MKIREVMTEKPHCAAPDDSVQAAAAVMRRENVGMLPVVEGEKLIGVITDRDIVIECLATDAKPAECRVRDHMTANPTCIDPDADAAQALELMGQEQIRRLCVVEEGKLVGVVALGDLAVQALPSSALAAALKHVSRRTWHLGRTRVHV